MINQTNRFHVVHALLHTSHAMTVFDTIAKDKFDFDVLF